MRRYLKLLPLMALFTAGVVLISLPRPVTAVPSAAPSISAPFALIGGVITVTATYTDDTPAGSTGATLTSSNAVGIFIAAALSPLEDEVVSVSGLSVTATEDLDTLAQSKTLTATFQCSSQGSTVFVLSHGGVASPPSIPLTCGNYSVYAPPYYGVYPPPPSGYYAIGQMEVVALPTSVACSSTSNITATVEDVIGRPAPNGTSVTFTTNRGTVSPVAGTTLGGSASTVFLAPPTGGTATITASSSTMSHSVTVLVTCPTAPVIVAPPVEVSPPQVLPPVIIAPPNTGDAGLIEGSTSNRELFADAS